MKIEQKERIIRSGFLKRYWMKFWQIVILIMLQDTNKKKKIRKKKEDLRIN